MANNIDQRIVDMKFDNSQFEKGVNQTVKTIDKLNEKLQFKNAGKGFKEVENSANKMKFGGLKGAVDSIAERFSSMGIVGMTVLQNLTNSAVNAGKRIASAFTIDPIKTGFQEYETQINAVQTILANTSSKGTTLNQVNDALDELNRYADMTIYNFTEMTRNIGTFTAAGVDLDTSVSAIKGIANLAAVSGSNSQQASTAMYQLSQALAAGTVKLQDWNSVVNAGMGGQVFQDALKETARVHGIKIDEMIEKEGSFRETLSNGWLTSAILTETLAKFTGDLSEEQLRSIGYTDEQTKAIMEMGKTANDAATKVKTFTQLMDTLKEAAQSGWTQSWEIIIGDFEEAKEFLTEISDTFSEIINNSSDARNAVLQGWKDLGGRTDLIDALRNVFQGLMSIIKPIKEAFEEVIPPVTAETLYNFTAKLKELTSYLKINDETADKLKRTFKGVFSVIDMVRQVIVAVGKVISNLLSKVFGLSGGFLTVTAAIGDFLTGLNSSIKSSEALTKLSDGLTKIFTKVANVVSKFTSVITRGISSFVNGGVDAAISLGDKMTPILSAIFDKIKSLFTSFIQNINFETVFTGVTGFLAGGLLVNLTKFVKKLTGMFEQTGEKVGLLDTVKESLSGLTGTLTELQTAVKAHAILTIAIAVGILAGSLVALASIDTDKLFTALGGLATIFGELVGALYLLQGMDFSKGSFGMFKMSGALISLAISVAILASAVKKLSSLNLEELAKGLGGVGVILLELVGFMKIVDFGKVSVRGMGSLILLAGALNLLAIAVQKLGQIDVKSLIKGLGSVAVLLGELAAFTHLVGDSKGLISTGIAMIAVAGAMLILSKAVGALGALSVKEIAKGLGAMAGAMYIIGVAMSDLMPKNMLANGAAMVLISGSILVLSSALSVLGSMSLASIAKGLIALGGSMFIIAGAMRMMQKALPGAAALTVVSVALMLLTPVLMALGSMSLESIGKSLLALAGTFTVLGIAASLLSPTIPALLGLAAAVALIGVGLGAAGVGVSALAIGLTALATSGGVATAAMTSMVESLLSLIPTLFKKIGEGIIALLEVIAGAGSTIIETVKTLLSSVLTAITEVAPQLGETIITIIETIANVIVTTAPTIGNAISVLIQEFLNVVNNNVPQIIETGMNLIMSFIQSIADNSYAMATAATTAIINFINGIAAQMNGIINAGINLAISFINGVANGIRNNQQPFKDAVMNLIKSIGSVIGGLFQDLLDFGKNIIDGLVQGIKDFGHKIGDVLTGIVNGAVDGIKNLLGIHSPSVVFRKIGEYCILGMTNGIEAMGNYSKKVAKAVVTKTVDVFSNASTLIADAMDTSYDFNPTITPVIDMSNVDKAMNNMDSMFSKQRGFDLSPTVELSKSALYRENQNGSQIGTSQESTVIQNFDMTQNNYSPKALSRLDIYRQTNNQFSRLKEALKA